MAGRGIIVVPPGGLANRGAQDQLNALQKQIEALRQQLAQATSSAAASTPSRTSPSQSAGEPLAEAHVTRVDNPHKVTAAQTGALAAGTLGAANGVAELDGAGHVPSGEVPLAAGAGIDVSGYTITNDDTGSAAVSAHDLAYVHSDIALNTAKRHDAATAGAGIGITGQAISNTDKGSDAVSAHDVAFTHSDIALNTAKRHDPVTAGAGISLSGQQVTNSLPYIPFAQRYPQLGGVPVGYWCNTTGTLYALSAATPVPGGTVGTVGPGVASYAANVWTTLPIPSITTPGAGVALCIAADANENVGILYQGTAGNLDLWFAYFNASTQAWSWLNITGNANTTYPVAAQACLTVDASGNWYAAWYQANSGSSGFAQVTYAKRTPGSSGTWSYPVAIGSAPLRAATGGLFLFVGTDGNPRIVRTNNAAATSSYNGVLYWNGSAWVTNNSNSVVVVAFATMDSNGMIEMFFTTNIYKFSMSNAWVYATSLTGAGMGCADTSAMVYTLASASSWGPLTTYDGTTRANATKLIQGPTSGTIVITASWQKPLVTPLMIVSTPYSIEVLALK